MARGLRGLGVAVAVLGGALALAAVVLALLVPAEPVERRAPFTGDLSDPAAYLAAREAAFDDITPGTQARIVWADGPGERTGLSLLVLHGFSATSEEIRPVPDTVAEALGANLVFARLRGHGRDGAALAAASASDWVEDTAEALAVARAVGDRVLILGVSTGGTLAAIALSEPDMAEAVAGLVTVSVNFELAHPAGRVLGWPGARLWAPWIVGAEQSFATGNDDHATYWTWSYPTVAAVSLAALMKEARARDYAQVDVPWLMIFAEEDRVVSADAARAVAARWGGAVTLAPQTLPEAGVDPYAHVIAGDILSPAMTDAVSAQIIDWARGAGLGAAD